MSSIVISGDTSGAITLAAPAVAGTNTVNLPAAAGTVMVSGNQPAFSAYLGGSNQSITTSTDTKVQLNTEEFDTASRFNNTGSTVGGIPSYAFLPNVAGYYQISGQVEGDGTGVTRVNCSIWKNGTKYKIGNDGVMTASYRSVVSCLVYLNGSTDWIEFYGYVVGTSPTFYNSSGSGCYFTGVLVRGA